MNDVLDELYAVAMARRAEKKEGSYTCYLFEQGLDKILKKIGEESAETIIAAFQANLLDQATAQRELKKLAEETSMFDTISEETIKGNEGKTFQDVTALRDPLMGLGFEEA